jgi:Na+-driven multidrug efflux pump
MLFFRLGGTWLLAFTLGWGLVGVWVATASDWAVRAAALFFFFRRGVWKKLHQIEKQRFSEPKPSAVS